MAIDTLYVNPSKTIAIKVFPGVVVRVIVGQVTRDHLEHSLSMHHHPIVGDRYVELCRIAPSRAHEIPDDEFRKLAAATLKQQSGRLTAIAYVVAGSGFVSSMAHMVIAGVSLLSRATHVEKVFSEPLPAASWLALQSPTVKLDPADIAATVDQLVKLTR